MVSGKMVNEIAADGICRAVIFKIAARNLLSSNVKILLDTSFLMNCIKFKIYYRKHNYRTPKAKAEGAVNNIEKYPKYRSV